MKRKILAIFIASFILIVAAYFLLNNFEVLEKLEEFFHFELGLVLLYFLAAIIVYMIGTLRWRQVIWSLGYNVPFKNLVMYNLAGYGFGYITPVPSIGGESMRALLLNKHKIPLKSGLTSVMINRTIMATATALFASVGLMYVIIGYKLGIKTKLVLILLFMLIIWLVISFYKKILSSKNQPSRRQLKIGKIKWLNNLLDHLWEIEYSTQLFFKSKKRDFWICFLLSFFAWIATGIVFKLGFLLVGYNAPFELLFLIMVFTDIAYMMPIPAALGVLEWGNVSAVSILNLPSLMGLALSLIIRMRDFFFVIIGLGYLFFQGIKIGKRPKRYVDFEESQG